jgi:hypothetical protein
MISIYVMPTEEGLPPRALVETPFGVTATRYEGGKWTTEDGDVIEELAEVITAHAKELGVELADAEG